MSDLHLNLKGIYFDDIKHGNKPFEYRLDNEYWRKRLEGRDYDRVFFKRGYPKADDKERIICKRYMGYDKQQIQHDHFGAKPVDVFAIHTTGEEVEF